MSVSARFTQLKTEFQHKLTIYRMSTHRKWGKYTHTQIVRKKEKTKERERKSTKQCPRKHINFFHGKLPNNRYFLLLFGVINLPLDTSITLLKNNA